MSWRVLRVCNGWVHGCMHVCMHAFMVVHFEVQVEKSFFGDCPRAWCILAGMLKKLLHMGR